MLPIRAILHPTDFSESSDNAFRLACSLARDYEAQVVVLHVTLSTQTYGVESMPIAGVTSLASKDEIEKRLGLLKAAASELRVDCHWREGDPADEILLAADKYKSDLIVMGTHGRTGLGRLLLGSVAEQVLRRASCPVLTLKTIAP